MTESRLLLGVASVLAGTAVLFVVLGAVANPILLLASLPFALAAYFLWGHATGRLAARVRRRRDAPGRAGPRGAATRSRAAAETGTGRADRPDPERLSAADILGVDPNADAASIRRAFRERARAVHPDAPDGNEAAFRRVRSAYETLRNDG